MENQFQNLTKRINILYVLVIVLFILSAGSILYIFHESPDNDVLKARGIVLTDENGNARILIGAPIPYAKNRVRTDTARVRDLWGKYFSEEYMEWYKEYENSANGILIMDEHGFDRLVIGSPTPDPNIGKRIGPATGIMINDQEGFERSGYGLISTEKGNRVVLGLDNEDGTEGLSLALFEDGTTGLIMNSPNNQIFIGKADSAGIFSDEEVPFFGLKVQSDSTFLLNGKKPITDK